MWLDTKIAKGVMVLQFRKVKGTMCPQFADNIVEDICQLNDCNFWEEVCCHSIVLLESAEVTYLCLRTYYTYGMFFSDFGLQKSDWA